MAEGNGYRQCEWLRQWQRALTLSDGCEQFKAIDKKVLAMVLTTAIGIGNRQGSVKTIKNK